MRSLVRLGDVLFVRDLCRIARYSEPEMCRKLVDASKVLIIFVQVAVVIAHLLAFIATSIICLRLHLCCEQA
jgi:hypothetical protein